jgi:hypothetical protein
MEIWAHANPAPNRITANNFVFMRHNKARCWPEDSALLFAADAMS